MSQCGDKGDSRDIDRCADVVMTGGGDTGHVSHMYSESREPELSMF